MLKIKDDVDLKELEKYNFVEGDDFYVDKLSPFDISWVFGMPIIDKHDRRIYMVCDKNKNMTQFDDERIIEVSITENVFNLIKDGLVVIEGDEEINE